MMADTIHGQVRLPAEFLYFKESGKYYASGSGYIPAQQWQGLNRATICHMNNGKCPGLSSAGEEFFITVIPPDGVPVLIKPLKDY